MRDILDPQDRWLGAPVGFLSSSNKAPVAIDDALSVPVDNGPVTIDVLANDSDPEGQALTLISATAALGTAVAEADNTVTYTPPPGISGFDTVIYEIADDLDQRQIGQVDITITGPTLTLTTFADNTMVIDAEPGPLDLTLTEPVQWAGSYSLNVGDLNSGPLNLVAPSVTGIFGTGEVLTAKGGLWIHDTAEAPLTQSWQWRANGTDITGATQSTYTVQAGDIGQVLTVAERQSDAAGQREASATVPSSQSFAPGVDAGLIGWWDASDAASLSETAGLVSAWADKAGGGVLAQSSTSARPVTGSRTLNGLNVLDFNGLQSLHDTARSLPTSGDIAFHMALEIDSTSNAFEAILSVDATNDFQLDAAHASRFDGQLNVSGIGTTTPLTGGPFSDGLVLSLIFDRTGATTAEVFIGDVSRGIMAYTAPIDASVALNVMSNRGLNARVDGAVAELILTTTLNNRADYHAYLAAKWGLA